jgi:L-rhamnose mutarotase
MSSLPTQLKLGLKKLITYWKHFMINIDVENNIKNDVFVNVHKNVCNNTWNNIAIVVWTNVWNNVMSNILDTMERNKLTQKQLEETYNLLETIYE